MGDQFISGVNLDEVLDNVLKGNEYNDNPHLSVTMIKNGLFQHLYNNFTQHGYDIPIQNARIYCWGETNGIGIEC